MANKVNLNNNGSLEENVLISYFQSGNLNFLIGAGASAPAINVAGDIEKEINEALVNKEQEAYEKAYNFIQEVIAKDDAELEKLKTDKASSVIDNYQNFLQNIDRILFERKNNLLPRQVNIFSTNYDMFVEYAADNLSNININDGFVRSYSQEKNLIYRSEIFFDRTFRSDAIFTKNSEIPTINLIKLHGSLSWRRDKKDDEIYFDKTPLKPLPEPVGLDRSDAIKDYLKKMVVILPVMSKFHDTLFERVYYDSFRILSKAMDAENAVLISFGFSFNDEHILDIVKRSLRNPTAQLIIFAYSIKDAKTYEEKFQAFKNVLIIAPNAEDNNTAKNIGFSELNQILNTIGVEKKECESVEKA